MCWRTWVARWLVRAASWMQPQPEAAMRVERKPLPPPPTKKRYTGRDSGTRNTILARLAEYGPMTREEIASRLDVQTAGTHLPRMVEDGLLVAVAIAHINENGYRSYRYQYHLAKPVAVDPVAHVG